MRRRHSNNSFDGQLQTLRFSHPIRNGLIVRWRRFSSNFRKIFMSPKARFFVLPCDETSRSYVFFCLNYTTTWQTDGQTDRQTDIHTVWVKKFPLQFSEIFPKRLWIFNQYFTHLLYDQFYTRLQISIQISPTLIKLCHTKRDHLANFYI